MSVDPLLGEVILFAGNFAPRGWALCEGQLLSIASNPALFSILGTTYGGDGRTSFALPDLRGRAPVQQGTGPGLSNIRLGQRGGSESVSLSLQNLPSHNHTGTFTGTPFNVSTPDAGTSSDPTGKVPANSGRRDAEYADPGTTPNTETPSGNITVNNNGGSQAFNNRNPYLGMNYIIALQGVFPSRN